MAENNPQYCDKKQKNAETEEFQIVLDKSDQVVGDHADTPQEDVGLVLVFFHDSAYLGDVFMPGISHFIPMGFEIRDDFLQFSSFLGRDGPILFLMAEGIAAIDKVLQMVVRDRNRIALQSDILGASALGIRNVLCLSGDHQSFGNQPDAVGVFDLDSIQFVQTVKGMRRYSAGSS